MSVSNRAPFAWRNLAPGELDHELLWLSITAVAGAAGLVWLRQGLPTPVCGFKALTGCPCPGCGATRAMIQLMHGQIAAAFRYNPLVFTMVGIVAGFDLYAATVVGLQLPRLRGSLRPPWPNAIRLGIFLALAANWWWVIRIGN